MQIKYIRVWSKWLPTIELCILSTILQSTSKKCTLQKNYDTPWSLWCLKMKNYFWNKMKNICKCACVHMFVDVEIIYFHQNVRGGYIMSRWNTYFAVKWRVIQKSGSTLPTFGNNCIVTTNWFLLCQTYSLKNYFWEKVAKMPKKCVIVWAKFPESSFLRT